MLPPACIIFTAGFICLEIVAFNPGDGNPYPPYQGLLYSAVWVPQSVPAVSKTNSLASFSPIISGPAYLFLCRLQIIRHGRVRVGTISLYIISIFLFTVVISLTSQGTSTFFSDQANDDAVRSSLAVLKASLVLQLFLNAIAVAVLASAYRPGAAQGDLPRRRVWRVQIVRLSLSIAVTMILIRNLFRTVQIFSPPESPIWTAEAYFWAFDATPMLAYTAVFHALHPAEYFPTQCDGSAARTLIERVDDVEARNDSVELQGKL